MTYTYRQSRTNVDEVKMLAVKLRLIDQGVREAMQSRMEQDGAAFPKQGWDPLKPPFYLA